jgi:uncharacterized protein with PIN domain
MTIDPHRLNMFNTFSLSIERCVTCQQQLVINTHKLDVHVKPHQVCSLKCAKLYWETLKAQSEIEFKN